MQNDSVDLYHVYTIQVGSTLFGFKHLCTPAGWHEYSGFANGKVTKETLATPPKPRGAPSLANF